jgi:hypothetical protein
MEFSLVYKNTILWGEDELLWFYNFFFINISWWDVKYRRWEWLSSPPTYGHHDIILTFLTTISVMTIYAPLARTWRLWYRLELSRRLCRMNSGAATDWWQLIAYLLVAGRKYRHKQSLIREGISKLQYSRQPASWRRIYDVRALQLYFFRYCKP